MNEGPGCFFLGAIFGTVVMATVGSCITRDDYKHGQIDALTGKVKYELVKDEDGQTVWVAKPTTRPA